MLALRLSAAASLLALSIGAGWHAWRGIRAEALLKQGAESAVREAARLDPLNPEVHARLAALDPGGGEAHLRRALALDPWRALNWIELASFQEVAGGEKAAEASLLEAARRSRYYIPRFSLAAFYYRHQDAASFRKWAAEALAVTYMEPSALFQMGRNLGIPLAEFQKSLAPKGHPVQASVARAALAANDLDTALAAVGETLAIRAFPTAGHLNSARNIATDAVVALHAAARIGDAAGLWNRMVDAGWIARGLRVDPSAGRPLANGDFTAEPGLRGFDWSVSSTPGADVAWWAAGSGVRIGFDGTQPERVDLLAAPLALHPGRRYRVATTLLSPDLPRESGIRWRVYFAEGGGAPLESPYLWGQAESEAVWEFASPAKLAPARLVLNYTRAPGTVRAEGALSLRKVDIQVVGEAQ